MSVGPIPNESIERYAERYLHPEEIDRFRRCIRSMDKEYMKNGGSRALPPPEKTLGPEMFDAMFGGSS